MPKQEQNELEHIELTNEVRLPGNVCFDPEKLRLHGFYGDELSAHRAKKTWVETLRDCFLLEPDLDFKIDVLSNLKEIDFSITCEFVSACGRYAFWRLTNNQAPEAQYMIETAHIPITDSNSYNLLQAPDLKSVTEEALEEAASKVRESSSFVNALKSAFNKIL